MFLHRCIHDTGPGYLSQAKETDKSEKRDLFTVTMLGSGAKSEPLKSIFEVLS